MTSAAPDETDIKHAKRQNLRLGRFLLAAVVASIPLENATVLPIGSISRLLGVLTAGTVLVEGLAQGGFRKMRLPHVPLGLFVVWSACTFYWSVEPGMTLDRIPTNIQLLFLVWLIWQCVRELEQLRVLLKGYVFGSLCAAIFTMQNAREMVAVDDIRYSGAGSDPNELGLIMVMSLPMMYYLYRTSNSRWRRFIWLTPFPAVVAGILLTVSRGAFITMAIALIGIALAHVTSAPRYRFAPIVAGVVLLIAGLAMQPKANLQRLATIEGEVASGRVGKRTVIWKAGLELFETRPLTGIGSATFAYAVTPLIGHDFVAHNVYVSVLTETGIIGFSIWTTVLAMLFAAALHMESAERSLWLTVLIIWCVGVSSLTWEYKKATWSVFAMVIATAAAPALSSLRPTEVARLYPPISFQSSDKWPLVP